MQPFYFGRTGRQLFGLHLAPQRRRACAAGVVLCGPAPQEYMRTHWAYRKLAALLSREGFHVLRFDYFGTGDSAGEGREGSLAQWRADVHAAAAELSDLAGLRRVSLVGLRLGAALAALAVKDGLPVRDLVLWEPAVDGRAHLADLERIERACYESLPHPPQSAPDELLQHPLPPALRVAIEELDLRTLGASGAERVLVFAERARPEHLALLETLRDRAGRAPEHRVVAEEAADGGSGVLLSTRVLQAIAGALSGGAT